MWEGREYLVAPLSLIRPGVLNGSDGPLYYPKEEISRNVQAWNNMPIVLEHTYDPKTGAPVLARSPKVLERQQLGTVFSAKVDNRGGLRAEGWFDVKKTNQKYPGLIAKIENEGKVELSTGLSLDKVPSSGKFGMREFVGVARNFRPDHVAILPNKKGACSLQDGCGVNNTDNALPDISPQKALKILKDGQVNGEPLTAKQKRLFGAIAGKAKQTQNEQTTPAKTKKGTMTCNDPGACDCVGCTKKRKKKSVISTTTTTNQQKGTSMRKLSEKGRAKLAQQLINNSEIWTEEDLEVINEFSDEKLRALVDQTESQVQNAEFIEQLTEGVEVGDEILTFNTENGSFMKKKKPTKAEEEAEGEESRPLMNEKPKTEEEWLKAAPVEVQNKMKFVDKVINNEKRKLIQTIVANCDESKREAKTKVLNSKSIDELQEIADLLPSKPVTNRRYEDDDSEGGMWMGNAPATRNQSQDDDHEEELLGVPTFNYAEMVKERSKQHA